MTQTAATKIIQKLELILSVANSGSFNCTKQEMFRISDLASGISVAMLSTHNSLAPINKLTNPDILYTIFDLAIIEVINDYEGYEYIALTHVCRYWRCFILSSPTLWRHINLKNMRWAEISLTRSAFVPLHVHIHLPSAIIEGGSEYLAEELEFVQNQSHRISFLEVSDIGGDADVLASALSTLAVPLLHTFKLWTVGLSSPSLPTLLNNNLPNLHNVELGYFTSWPVSLCANVVHLSLLDQPRFDRPSISSFLDLLEASPNLVHLQLENSGPRGKERTSFDRVILLPKLKTLEMTQVYSHLILSHITLPVDAFLSLTSAWVLPEAIPAGLPTNVSHLANLAETEVLRISFDDFLYVMGTTRCPQWVCFYIENRDRATRKRPDLWLEYLQPLPRNQIKELWIEDYDDSYMLSSYGSAYMISYWQNFLNPFKSLETLVVSDSSIAQLFGALSQPHPSLAEGDIPCHQLVSLHVFDRNGPSGMEFPLANFLRTRNQCGHSIQNFRLMYPGSGYHPPPIVPFEAKNVGFIEQEERPVFRSFDRVFY